MKRLAFLLIIAAATPIFAQNSKKISAQEQTGVKTYMDSLIQSKHYIFMTDRASTTLATLPIVDLVGQQYYFKVKGDTIISELPFFGKSTSTLYNQINSPLSYTSESFKYEVKEIKRKKYSTTMVTIYAKPKSIDVNKFDITIEIHANGSAIMNVRGTNLSNITFFGNIEKIDTH